MANSNAQRPCKRQKAVLSLLLGCCLLSACGPAPQKGKKLQKMECGGVTTIEFYDQREFDKECIRILEGQRAGGGAQ